jgi:hypothetical protein
VSLALQLTNLSDTPIIIEQIAVPKAVVIGGSDLLVPEFGAERFYVLFEFHGEVPGIFTAIMDFGDGSSGPLLVIP